MTPYILHVAILISGFFLIYKRLLERETFHQLNRWLLVLFIGFSFSLPYFETPEEWSVWQEKPPSLLSLNAPAPGLEHILSEKVNEKPDRRRTDSEAAIKAASDAAERRISQEPIAALSDKKEVINEPGAATTILPKESSTQTKRSSYSLILKHIYLGGLIVFGLNWLIQLSLLFLSILRNSAIRDGRYRIVEWQKDVAPYSFLNHIFINPGKYDWDSYRQILEHEKIHVSQGHSIDMILAELLAVVLWFNPFAWLYRKAVEDNLEFLTDQTMLNKGADRESYQMNLLKVAAPNYSLAFTNNYNHSILKKRIMMMNIKKSSLRSGWKYLSIIPMLWLSVICLNPVQTAAHTSKFDHIEKKAAIQKEVLPEKSKEEPLNNDENAVKKLKVADALLMEETPLRGKSKADAIRSSDELETKTITHFNLASLKGTWKGEIDGDKLCMAFDLSKLSEGNHWQMSRCFQKSEFSSLPMNREGEFKLTREAGEINFKGSFEGEEGIGRFEFSPSVSFSAYLQQQGIQEVTDKAMFHFFIADINKAYLTYLKQNDYGAPSAKELQQLAIHQLTLSHLKEYLPALSAYGIDRPPLKKLVSMKIHHVSKEYIVELGQLGIKDLSPEDLIKGKIHHVDPAYIKELQGLGFKDLSFEEHVRFAIHHVKLDLVKALAEAGYKDLTGKQLVSASIHHVNINLLESIQVAGYSLPTMEQLISYSIHHVKPAFITALKEAGYNNVSPKEVISASIHHVTADYISELKKLGFTNFSLKEITNMSIHHAGPAYLSSLKELGYGDLSAASYTNAAIHHVDAGFIKGLNDLGFKDIPMKQVVNLKIHHVTPDFIRRAREKGHTDLSLEEYRSLKIHNKL